MCYQDCMPAVKKENIHKFMALIKYFSTCNQSQAIGFLFSHVIRSKMYEQTEENVYDSSKFMMRPCIKESDMVIFCMQNSEIQVRN